MVSKWAWWSRVTISMWAGLAVVGRVIVMLIVVRGIVGWIVILGIVVLRIVMRIAVMVIIVVGSVWAGSSVVVWNVIESFIVLG